MSRSYRKYPVIRQAKVDKKYCNRRARNLKDDISYKGGCFKKLYMRDNWRYRWSREEATIEYLESNRFPNSAFPTLESWLQYWEKCARRK